MHGLGPLPPWETARVYFSIMVMLCGPCRMSLQLQSHGTEPEEPGCRTKSIGAIALLVWFLVLVPGWRRLDPFGALKGAIIR